MKKLMRFTTEFYTTTGQRIKSSLLIFACFILLGCPKKEPPAYNMQIINKSESTIHITTKSEGLINLEEDFSYETFVMRSNSIFIDGLFELETDNPVAEFLDSWGGNNRFRIYKSDSLLVDWRGPAYDGGEADHHFYNINAWEVDEHPESSDVIYTITFTIYPEDLVQDEN